jgi:uroporphyrin-3 C-methyltransferase
MSNEADGKIIAAQPKKLWRIPWGNIGILGAIFSVSVLVLVGSYGYFHLIAVNKQAAAAATTAQNQLQQLQADFIELQKSASAVEQLADDIKSLRQSVNTLAQAKQSSQTQWLMEEARYFVKLANHNLQFAHNVQLAMTLLKLADREVSAIDKADVQGSNLRRALAADIAHLHSTPQVDVAGLYMKLMALNGQLDKLPLLIKQANIPESNTPVTPEQKQEWWQRGLHSSWQVLKSMVIVRYNRNGLVPLMTPDQQVFLYQNLHALLAQATWALLHQQSIIYQTSLQQTVVWIKQYFLLESPMTQAVLSDLVQLEKIDVQQSVPSITDSLKAFGAA